MSTDKLRDAADEGPVFHEFDQTNGLVQGVDGDSDGTLGSDEQSDAERHDPRRTGNPGDLSHGDKGEATATSAMAWRRGG